MIITSIGIDFDGTCVEHAYPRIGSDIGAAPILKRLVDNGYDLILTTMRDGDDLLEAVHWFKKNEIRLHGIQTHPTQKRWTESPKAYAELYIDDRGLGIPLKHENGKLPYVDWVEVEKLLTHMGLLYDE